MKRIKHLLTALLCACCLTLGAFASSDLFSIKTAVTVPAAQRELTLSVTSGEVLEFSAQDLEKRLEFISGGLRGITVTALPDPSQGMLVLDGVEVDRYQYISRDELAGLCFVPNESASTASITLTPQGADSISTQISISVLNTLHEPPVAENASFSTVKNVRITGFVTALDPNGDAFLIKVMRLPDKGDVSFTGQIFVYEPYKNATGSDSFTFCAVDRFGNYSNEATVDIKIENTRSGFQFVDMAGNPSAYAAFKLHEKGVLNGEKVGKQWFFHPSRQVTRGEFLVMLLAAAGMDSNLPATVNTQLEGDAALPMWLKPYIKKALDEGIWNLSWRFAHDQPTSRAEAVILTALAAKINDVKDYPLQMGDSASIPSRAQSSYKALAAYRMLDLHDGHAHPTIALDNAYAADLLWQLYKHTHR